jgi:uncharacterized protein YydD (DUF2326 family)
MMIHYIKSNNPNFKTVELKSGFNIILADRRDGNTDEKRTRNGAGKSTLIEIIHFCLGSQVNKNSVFKNENLKDWSFILGIDIGECTYTIERFTNNPNKIYISGDIENLEIECKYDKVAHRYYVTPNLFNKTMSNKFYGIETNEENVKYTPSFRELISYAIRKNVDGYKNAFEFFSRQKAYSIQSCNSYFLNMSMEYVAKFQLLKEKKKAIDDYVAAVKSGFLGNLSFNIGELNSEVIALQKDLDDLKEQLDSFQIHPQYTEIANKTNVLTEKIHELTNDMILKKQLLERYENNYCIEDSNLPLDDIKDVYSDVGVLFNDKIIKTLSEVIEFHKEVSNNRRTYLQEEISTLKKGICELEKQIEIISNERAELMRIVQTHGALEEYTLIQEKYSKSMQLLEETKNKLESIEYIEDSKSHIKIENQELLLKLRQDYNERSEKIQQAVSIFKNNTEYLYPEAGMLTIDVNETGYKFDVDIKSSRSQGVNYMKVFCYDMLLAELGCGREIYPKFLIHDSTIFDGVDERQVAKALMLAKTKCEELNFQYITLINSDMIPYHEFDSEFVKEFDENVILRISDEQENGGLLGIRF